MTKCLPKATKIFNVAMMSLLCMFTFSTSATSNAQAAPNDILLYIVEFPGDCEGEALPLPERLPETVTPNKDKSNKFSFKECRTICQAMSNCTGFSFSTEAKKHDADSACNLKKVKNKYCPAVERIVNDMNYYSRINVPPKDGVAPAVDLSAQAAAPVAPAPDQTMPAATPDAIPAAPVPPAPEQAAPVAPAPDQVPTEAQPAPQVFQDPANTTPVAIEPAPL